MAIYSQLCFCSFSSNAPLEIGAGLEAAAHPQPPVVSAHACVPVCLCVCVCVGGTHMYRDGVAVDTSVQVCAGTG